MPSFDIVSEVDQHEVSNAVDQANRELSTRFDFKGIDAKFELEGTKIVISAPSDFQLKQLAEILQQKLTKREVDIKALKFNTPEVNISQAKQDVEVLSGIDKDNAKKIVKIIKDQKLKVQASIQGEQVRVTGKKRDDLQEVISVLKESPVEIPLQYDNFRD